MSAHHIEVERKYEALDPQAPAPTPDWGQLEKLTDGRLTVMKTVTEDMTATYLDTVDGRLAAAKVAVRRRVGGYDQGWHVKFDDGSGNRHEMHFDLIDPVESLPTALYRALRNVTHDHELHPTVGIQTLRRRSVLTDRQGTEVAEICADQVESHSAADDSRRAWSEWEVELLTPGALEGEEIFDACERVLQAAGIGPSVSPAKLVRALGKDAAFEARRGARGDRDDHAAAASPQNGEKNHAGATPEAIKKKRSAPPSSTRVLSAALTQLIDQLLLRELRLRAGDTTAVHELRQTAQSLGAVLRFAVRPYVRSEADALEVDACTEVLRELRTALAPARDLDIVEQSLNAVQPLAGVLTAHDVENLHRQLAEDRANADPLGIKRFNADSALHLHKALGEIAEHTESFVELPLNPENYLNKVAKRIRKSLTVYLKEDYKDVWVQPTADFAYAEDSNELLFDIRRAAQSGLYCLHALSAGLGERVTDDQRRLMHTCIDLHRELSVISDEQVFTGWLYSTARRAARGDQDRLGIGYLMGRSSYYQVGLRMTDHALVPAELKKIKKLSLK